MRNLFVVVSTMNGVVDSANYPNGDYELIIVNQGTPSQNCLNIDSIGLSNSRNAGIEHVKSKGVLGDIIVLADNDCKFLPGFDSVIRNFYRDNPTATFCTFKALDNLGNDFKSNYKSEIFKHNSLSIMKVSSIEITFVLQDNFPKFDPSFGLGSAIPIGEENIFAADWMKTINRMYFCPCPIVIHDDDRHSGTVFSTELTRFRLKVFKRVYGGLSTLIFFLYLVKNASRLQPSFAAHFKEFLRGF